MFFGIGNSFGRLEYDQTLKYYCYIWYPDNMLFHDRTKAKLSNKWLKVNEKYKIPNKLGFKEIGEFLLNGIQL